MSYSFKFRGESAGSHQEEIKAAAKRAMPDNKDKGTFYWPEGDDPIYKVDWERGGSGLTMTCWLTIRKYGG